ncbi:hypothetical protein ARC63_04340 [Stenotrophomonas geniculata ATCC 19374 = JCM 13324]|nr:hypothetical protein ARC63_04340 [Stenotrophomonas geniculata ATCC 19374 = JCM 13324]
MPVKPQLEVASEQEVQAFRAKLAFVELGLLVAIQGALFNLEIAGEIPTVFLPVLFDEKSNLRGVDDRRILGEIVCRHCSWLQRLPALPGGVSRLWG